MLVLRFRSKQGMLRVELPDEGATYSQLKDKLGELLPGVAKSDIKIKRQADDRQEVSASEDRSLRDIGLRHGDMLFVDVPDAAPATAGSAAMADGSSAPGPGSPARPAQGEAARDLKDIKKSWTMREYLAHRDKLAIKIDPQETPHCVRASVSHAAVDAFQQYIRQMQFRQMRFGWLYGRVLEDKSVMVEAIYEPVQIGKADGVSPDLADSDSDSSEEAARLESMAALLGLTRVGLVFTHRPRPVPLLASEALFAAEMQSKYDASFVTLVGVLKEDGLLSFEAYQASDKAVELVSQPSQPPMFSPHKEDPCLVVASQKVVIDRKETQELDVHRILVAVPIVMHEGPFRVAFPIENRADTEGLSSDPVRANNVLSAFLAGEQVAKTPFGRLAADFHFLLFVTKHFFPLDGDGAALCLAVAEGSTDSVEGFEMLLKSYAGLME